MKRICMIIPSFEAKGGIASVVSGYRGSELEEKYQISYIETYCDGSKAAKLGKAIASYFRFTKQLIFSKPDLIHIHSSFGASFYRKLPFIYIGSLLHIPIVNHVHGAEWCQFYQNASARSKNVKKKTFKKCDMIIALSEEWKKNLNEVIDAQKIQVVNNYGFDYSCGLIEERQLETVLFMGFLCERKGCFNIPEICTLVKYRIPDVRFVLAGSGSHADIKEIETLIKKYGITENIELPGWIKEKQKDALLKKASLFFLPSYAEGMPMSVLEAMGYGLPIVSSNVGGIPHLVENGKNGYLLDPGDVEGFAKAIVKLLQDPKLRNRMGAESANAIKERFSLKRHTDSIIGIYENLL